MKILATVCARGGSKGVKNKNIKSLLGKPLIYYTIDLLKRWNKSNHIVCSTDSKQIAKVAKKCGALVPFMRPAELATDTAGKVGVIRHALQFCEDLYKIKYDAIIDLDVTAPIRKIKDVNGAFNKFKKYHPDIVYSVVKARKNPYFNMVEQIDKKGYVKLCKKLKTNVLSRQAAPIVYEMNASIYVYDRDFLLRANSVHDGKAIAYEMDELSSFDVDKEIDFEFLKFLFKKGYFKYE